MRFNIDKKLYAAFGVVVLIMLAMVVFNNRAGSQAKAGVSRVAEMNAETAIAAQTVEHMLMVRLAMNDFLLTNSPDSLEQIENTKKVFRADLAECQETFHSPQRTELVNEIASSFKNYELAFSQVSEIIQQRNQLINHQVDVVGPHLTKDTTHYREAALQQGDGEKLAIAEPLCDTVMETRISALKYIRSNHEGDLEQVNTLIENAHTMVAQLRDLEQDQALLDNIDTITADLNEYANSFQQIEQLIHDRNAIVTNQMTLAGEQIDHAGAQILSSLKADGIEVRDSVNSQLHASMTKSLIAAGLAIAIAMILSVFVSRGITKPIHVFLSRFELIAAGDLTQRVDCSSNDEIGDLAKGFNVLIAEIADIINNVQSTAGNVAAAATQVAASSEQMASSTDQQRDQLNQVSAAVEQLSATINEVSGRTAEVSRQSTDAGAHASEGGRIVANTVQEMDQIASQVETTSNAVSMLSAKADQIGDILVVINDIAEQTNLLALNAAIEAARAGEHGRGFAVVADEVRKLAERTQTATQEVSSSIAEIQHSTNEATSMMSTSRNRVTSGVEMAQQAGNALGSIVEGSNLVAQSVDSIAAAVEEQSATSSEIARAIESISAAADDTTRGAGEASTAANQLSGSAESLRELVTRFKAA